MHTVGKNTITWFKCTRLSNLLSDVLSVSISEFSCFALTCQNLWLSITYFLLHTDPNVVHSIDNLPVHLA